MIITQNRDTERYLPNSLFTNLSGDRIVQTDMGYKFLDEQSTDDYRFTKWKRLQQDICRQLNRAAMHKESNLKAHEVYKIRDVADKIVNCCSELRFKIYKDGTHKFIGSSKVDNNLTSSYPCHQKLCPLCSWRQRLKEGYLLSEALKRIDQDLKAKKEALRVLHVTLTIPNCPIKELKEGYKKLKYGFKKLRDNQYKAANSLNIKIKDYFYRIETTYKTVSRGLDTYVEAHPHLHILLLVPASYNKYNSELFHPTSIKNNPDWKYYPNKSWRQIWAEGLGLKDENDWQMCYVQDAGFIGDMTTALTEDSINESLGKGFLNRVFKNVLVKKKKKNEYYTKKEYDADIWSENYWEFLAREEKRKLPYSEEEIKQQVDAAFKVFQQLRKTTDRSSYASEIVEKYGEEVEVEVKDRVTKEIVDVESMYLEEKLKKDNDQANRGAVRECVKYVNKPDSILPTNKQVKTDYRESDRTHVKNCIDQSWGSGNLKIGRVYLDLIEQNYGVQTMAKGGLIRQAYRDMEAALQKQREEIAAKRGVKPEDVPKYTLRTDDREEEDYELVTYGFRRTVGRHEALVDNFVRLDQRGCAENDPEVKDYFPMGMMIEDKSVEDIYSGMDENLLQFLSEINQEDLERVKKNADLTLKKINGTEKTHKSSNSIRGDPKKE